MKIKLQNVKNGVIKGVEKFLVEDYLATREWVLYKEEKTRELKKSTKK